ncbi:MAG: hypothetical protein C5B55_04560 [Blastocatellia bacterium]|nr:MAG: hypothetical protein C5B55_04560 [Blastocatellia bacterium]
MSNSSSHKPWLYLISFIGVIVPGRLRADWMQEWEAELQYREAMLAEWDRLNRRTRFHLIWRSAGAFWDALWMQTYRWEDAMFQDIRYAIRMMRKAPGFTAVAVIALGLGIGVNTAIFSAVNGFVMRPLPANDSDNLMWLHWGSKKDPTVWGEFSYPNYIDLREHSKTVSDACLWFETSAGISSGESRSQGDDERADLIWGEVVSANYFDVMGVKPILGRAFLPGEDLKPNGITAVVIGHKLWRERFHSDKEILTKTVFLNGHRYSVTGVMPEDFLGSVFFLRHSFWVPLNAAQDFGRKPEWRTDRGYTPFSMFGRLKPGVTVVQATADLNSIVSDLAQQFPKENGGTKIQITKEVDARYKNTTKVIQYGAFMALCVAILVLLVACANVANLMLARAATRARELGVRLAIGAGRGRIIRQLLTESVLLALMGGVLGWGLAYAGSILIASSFPPVPYPVSLTFTPDLYVLKWMSGIAIVTGLVFGLAPALLASRTDLIAVIKGGGEGQQKKNRRLNVRGTLVVTQVMISIVVLICAGLFIRSLRRALETDPGFKTDNMVTMMVNPRILGYDEKKVWRLFPELLHRIEESPGVRVAALTDDLPLQAGDLIRGPIVREGEADPLPNQGVNVHCNFVSPKYFETVRTLLVLGRDFTERDNAEAPRVVVVNKEFARRFYGAPEQAMGKRFRFAEGTPLMEIVGIAQDGLYHNLYEDRAPHMFLPLYQQPYAAVTLVISAQSSADLGRVAESAREHIAQLEPRLPVVGLMVEEQNLAIPYWGPRLAAGTATTFGILALVLATMGLYSVMTYTVSQRTREIGIRMALGATLRDVLRLIVSQGMRMVIVGLLLGLAGAFALTRVFAKLLLGVDATDPLTFVGVVILLLSVGLLACLIPARRATKINPLIALRHE